MIRNIRMYRMQSYDGINPFFILMRYFNCLLRSIYLGTNVYHPSIIIKSSFNNCLPIFIKCLKIEMRMYIYIFEHNILFAKTAVVLVFKIFLEVSGIAGISMFAIIDKSVHKSETTSIAKSLSVLKSLYGSFS